MTSHRTWLLALLLFSCADRQAQVEHAHAGHPSARPWPEAGALFHRDPSWAGGDSAYSVELDDQHVLWLFGDTFVDPAADGTRVNNPNYFVRNSVAIQGGPDRESAHDLSRASIAFYWGPLRDREPSSFFELPQGESALDHADAQLNGPAEWLWPLAGVRIADGPLLLFRMHVFKTEGGLGFALRGWDAVAVDDPLQAPDAWAPRMVQPLSEGPNVLVGTSVLVHEGFLYAYAARNDDRAHSIALARWPLASLTGLPAGVLSNPEWWNGAQFIAQSDGGQPQAVFDDGQTELSVSYDAETQRFIEVQMRGLALAQAATALVYRTATRPEGPWSKPQLLLRPPEAERADADRLVTYAGKAHPEQNGPGLVVSYVVHDLKALVPDDSLYYPVFARVQLR
jgi:hypothetical protein